MAEAPTRGPPCREGLVGPSRCRRGLPRPLEHHERWHPWPGILGDDADVGSLRQAAHRARARRAGQEAAHLSGLVPQMIAPAQGVPSPEVGPEVGL